MNISFVHPRWRVVGLLAATVPIPIAAALAYADLLGFGFAIGCVLACLPGIWVWMQHTEQINDVTRENVLLILEQLPRTESMPDHKIAYHPDMRPRRTPVDFNLVMLSMEEEELVTMIISHHPAADGVTAQTRYVLTNLGRQTARRMKG